MSKASAVGSMWLTRPVDESLPESAKQQVAWVTNADQMVILRRSFLLEHSAGAGSAGRLPETSGRMDVVRHMK